MLLNHDLYDGVTVYIVSRDTVFARMLELELTEAGMTAVRAETPPDEDTRNGEIRVFTVSSDVLEGYPELFAHVEFGYSDTGSGRSGLYFKRPFAVEELVAAVADLIAVSRADDASRETRAEQPDPVIPVTKESGLTLDGESGVFSYNGQPLAFTETERVLLLALYENRGNAVSREELLERVWGRSEGVKTNLTDVYIRYLREKLDDRFDVRLILSVRGKGYMLK